MEAIQLFDMLPVSQCVAKCDSEHLVLSGYGYVRTRGVYEVPLTIEAEAKTDSTNLRLHFAKGHVILNWEAVPDQLACYEPVYGHAFHVREQGRIPRDTWVKVSWVIERDFMQVLVDDELRFTNEGDSGDEFHRIDYRGLLGPVCIGPGWGSTVTVRSLAVEELD
ncbi:MAG: hypothetical protein OXR72_19720 [Gemmatimonadota bacterium]|nr:hypothetical protein [Gemmatimonadota bacterium]